MEQPQGFGGRGQLENMARMKYSHVKKEKAPWVREHSGQTRFSTFDDGVARVFSP